LGDFHLKYKEFNEYNQKNYKRPIKNFNGPYIKSNPDIKIFDITPNDEYIVLGTDGLWDLMGSKDVAEIIKSNPNSTPKSLSKHLFNECMNKAATSNMMSVESLIDMPAGRKKRSIHDDISIIVFSLKNQK
jgi:pyruvate dehydrogenase phosphatase